MYISHSLKIPGQPMDELQLEEEEEEEEEQEEKEEEETQDMLPVCEIQD